MTLVVMFQCILISQTDERKANEGYNRAELEMCMHLFCGILVNFVGAKLRVLMDALWQNCELEMCMHLFCGILVNFVGAKLRLMDALWMGKQGQLFKNK